jgi:hypothetical protein
MLTTLIELDLVIVSRAYLVEVELALSEHNSCSNRVFMEVIAWSITHKKYPVLKVCSADNVLSSVLL